MGWSVQCSETMCKTLGALELTSLKEEVGQCLDVGPPNNNFKLNDFGQCLVCLIFKMACRRTYTTEEIPFARVQAKAALLPTSSSHSNTGFRR